MKRAALFLAFAAAASFATGAVAQWLPYYCVPQFGLLAVVGLADRQGGAVSLAVTWATGVGYDLLSTAPFGYHGLLFCTAWAATRIASHQVDLRNPLLYAAFVSGLSIGLAGLGASVAGAPPVAWRSIGPVVAQAAICAALAHPMRSAVVGWLERFDSKEPARGALRLGVGGARP